MATCPACNRHTATLYNQRSLIDFKERKVCTACLYNNAEALDAIVTFDGHVVGQEIQEAIRVYDPGDDDGNARYLTLEEWLDRHTTHAPEHLAKSRQPAPCNNLDPEPYNDPVEYEEKAIVGLLAKQKAAIESMTARKDDVGVPWPRSE